jgi:glycerol-1-phosphate dehydrogenase [NAD(P)+]
LSEPAIDVVIGPDAVDRLTAVATAARWPGALVVSDANTREVAGEAVAAALRGAGIVVREHVFEQREGLLAGLGEADLVRRRISELMPVVVGSGVLTDIARYAAHAVGRDFISVPTAASMDGYASAAAAMQIDGVKVTSPARAPVGIYADPGVVAAAPIQLTRAGIGDLLAKATARVDWLAAHLLYGEPFGVDVADRVLGPLRFAATRADEIMTGDVAGARGLLDGLIESGIAITLCGNTRPASGCEHHASHFWDLLAAHGRRAHASHGLQTGYATGFAMRLQRYAFAGGVEALRAPVAPLDPLSADARAWLGEPTDDLRVAVSEKQRMLAAPPPSWPADETGWRAVRAALASPLALFDEVRAGLRAAGIPDTPGYLEIDEPTLRATFHYASRLRARYTTIDFLEGQGALDDAIDDMLSPPPMMGDRSPILR